MAGRNLITAITAAVLAAAISTNADDCFKFTQTQENVCENCPPAGHSTACGTCPPGRPTGHQCGTQSITVCLKYSEFEQISEGSGFTKVTLDSVCWVKKFCVAPENGQGYCFGSETCVEGDVITAGPGIGVIVQGSPCTEPG